MELPLSKNCVLVQNHSNEVEFDFPLNKPVSNTHFFMKYNNALSL